MASYNVIFPDHGSMQPFTGNAQDVYAGYADSVYNPMDTAATMQSMATSDYPPAMNTMGAQAGYESYYQHVTGPQDVSVTFPQDFSIAQHVPAPQDVSVTFPQDFSVAQHVTAPQDFAISENVAIHEHAPISENVAVGEQTAISQTDEVDDDEMPVEEAISVTMAAMTPERREIAEKIEAKFPDMDRNKFYGLLIKPDEKDKAKRKKFVNDLCDLKVLYRDIKVLGDLSAAESTLRGIRRNSIVPAEQRPRCTDDQWTPKQVCAMQACVSTLQAIRGADPTTEDGLKEVRWEQVAEMMVRCQGPGTFKFSGAAVHRRFKFDDQLTGKNDDDDDDDDDDDEDEEEEEDEDDDE